jgi:hypothetical protein
VVLYLKCIDVKLMFFGILRRANQGHLFIFFKRLSTEFIYLSIMACLTYYEVRCVNNQTQNIDCNCALCIIKQQIINKSYFTHYLT